MVVKEDIFNKVWRPSPHVVTRKIVDETILVPVAGNLADMQRLFTVNEMGDAVWAMLDGKKTVQAIRDALLDEFEVDADQLESDLAAFIGRLTESGLIREQTE